MLKFTLGLVTGVFVAKPIQNLINEHLTPSVRKRITKAVTNLADRLNNTIEPEDSK